jgi:CHAT domain-containing protein
LQHAEREITAIEVTLGVADLSSADPSPHELCPAQIAERTVDGAEILHLAAHSRLDAAVPELSGIVLADSDGRERVWMAWEIARTPLPVELVYLSLCSSGHGELITGEGTLSLARAFLLAGARSVIVTLWPIRDHFAAEFARVFYQAWSTNISAAETLTLAQRSFLGYPPSDWAAFTVMGDAAGARRGLGPDA